jgi:hypothetical protein
MIKVIQSLPEEDEGTLKRTPLTMMSGSLAHKAATCAEEEVSVCIRQWRESVKGRVFDKDVPVNIMVIGHGSDGLNKTTDTELNLANTPLLSPQVIGHC